MRSTVRSEFFFSKLLVSSHVLVRLKNKGHRMRCFYLGQVKVPVPMGDISEIRTWSDK